MILTDTSNIYNSDMTISDVAERYTATDQTAWALNVANKLGVSPDTKVSTLLTEATAGVGAIVVLIALVLYFRDKV
jgi:prolyl-tRNA editing enzyme YbaK/EbsC (Cys-tRNA(Pro) deacylase)